MEATRLNMTRRGGDKSPLYIYLSLGVIQAQWGSQSLFFPEAIWLNLKLQGEIFLLNHLPLRFSEKMSFHLCHAETKQCESALQFPPFSLAELPIKERTLYSYMEAMRNCELVPHFYHESIGRAKGVSEHPLHSSAKRQCESEIHFCWVGIYKAKWELKNTNQPSSHNTSTGEYLTKKED